MIGIITAGSWHNSIGDIATGAVTADFLARRGIPVAQVEGQEAECDWLVIGGGDLLYGGTVEPWKTLLGRFRVPGRHAFNAVGLNPEGREEIDWRFASEYRLVAARDLETAEFLGERLQNVTAVPCPATLVEPYPWEFVRELPGFEVLKQVQPGEYVAVHKHPRLAPVLSTSMLPVIAVDAQAFALHAWPDQTLQLPATHSARIVQTVIANAHLVVTSSLHLAIFAMGAAVPFAVPDFQDRASEKVRRYLRRAGLPEAMVSHPGWMEAAEELRRHVAQVSAQERARSHQHLEALVALAKGPG